MNAKNNDSNQGPITKGGEVIMPAAVKPANTARPKPAPKPTPKSEK